MREVRLHAHAAQELHDELLVDRMVLDDEQPHVLERGRLLLLGAAFGCDLLAVQAREHLLERRPAAPASTGSA